MTDSGVARGDGSRRKGVRRGLPASAGSPPERAAWLGLGRANAFLLAAGVAVIAAGYALLDRGSITAAPVLLILGYAVLIPAGLLLGLRRERRPPE